MGTSRSRRGFHIHGLEFGLHILVAGRGRACLRERGSLVAFSGGLAQIAIHSVETLAAYTLAWHVAQEGNLAVVQALFDLQNLAVYYWAIPVAAMLTVTSIITVRTLVFPHWVAADLWER